MGRLRAVEANDEPSSAVISPELSGASAMARLKRRVRRRQVSPSANSNDGDPALAGAEQLLQRGLEAVVEAVIDAAAAGDMAAARMVLDRQFPAPRDRRISFQLRPIDCTEDAIKASADVLMAVAAGQITPAEADVFAKLLHNFVEASTLQDFERRLEALETATLRDSERRLEALEAAAAKTTMRKGSSDCRRDSPSVWSRSNGAPPRARSTSFLRNTAA